MCLWATDDVATVARAAASSSIARRGRPGRAGLDCPRTAAAEVAGTLVCNPTRMGRFSLAWMSAIIAY
jgi:hypothetical protein